MIGADNVGVELRAIIEALADVERAERRLAVEVATFHATYDKMHPDDVPVWLRGVVYSAHAVLARVSKTDK